MRTVIALMAVAVMASPLSATASHKAPSNLIFVSKKLNLSVIVDGKRYGKYTSKRVEVEGVKPGVHQLVIKTLNPKVLKKRVAYNGKYKVPAGREVRLDVSGGKLNLIGMSALAAPAAAQPDAPNAPVQSFGDGPSIVHVNTDKYMTMILVDGASTVEQGDCSTPKACDVYDVAPGPHEFDIRSGLTGKKVLYKGRVEIPGSAEVWAKVRGGKFEIYNTRPRQDLGGAVVAGTGTTTSTTTTIVESGGVVGGGPEGVSAHMTVIDPDTGEVISVSAGISMGGMAGTSEVHVTETTTTVHEGQPVSGFGTIQLTSTDGESFTVFIDGQERGDCNCMDGQSMTLRKVEAGEHKLVIKEFVGDEVYASGRIWVEPGFKLKLGVSQNGVEAFNRVDAWSPGY